MGGSCVYNEIVAEPLTKENSAEWFVWVRNFLIARDLWEVVEGTAEPPEVDFVNWRRKNAAALHIIQISCASESFSHIREVIIAHVAWDILTDLYKPPMPPSHPSRPSSQKLLPQVTEDEVDFNVVNLYKAICHNNWHIAKQIIDEHPRALSARVTTSGKTALHVAALFGQVGLVEELMRIIPQGYLEIVDSDGYTPLLAATVTGVTRVAECMVDKNKKVLSIPNPNGALPVSLAFAAGHKEMAHYLYSVTPLEDLKPANGPLGPVLLHVCFDTGDLDINIQSTIITSNVRVEIQQRDEKRVQEKRMVPGFKQIYQLKLLHAQAAEILRLVCAKVTRLDKNMEQQDRVADALFRAAREGIVEVVLAISKANPEIVLISNNSLRHMFFFAIQYRQAEIFNLVHGFRFKDSLTSTKDAFGNTLLHVAGMLAPSSKLNSISGAALQMQRELQWFKEVESVVPPTIRVAQNMYGMQPVDVFKESHRELMKEGEKWLKETASSCSVVGALIVTIMFAAAFTVPGGNNQESGYPLFLDKEDLFMLFLISDALSLFSSSTSVLMFLGILTSRYSENDFLKSLPRKLIIGLSALFLSIATMMIAFSATILIMLQHTRYSWALLPVIMLASVPVTLFVLLQFPLLVQIIYSTYGPGIFHRKVEVWP